MKNRVAESVGVSIGLRPGVLGRWSGHRHQSVAVSRRIPQWKLDWLAQPLACCLVCGQEIVRGDLMRCPECGEFHFPRDAEFFFDLVHECVYDPISGNYDDMLFLGDPEMSSVDLAGSVAYGERCDVTIRVSESWYDRFPYWKLDSFKGFLGEMCSK
jgi:hypothetical protein